MKAKINGIEIEGTPQEIKEFIDSLGSSVNLSKANQKETKSENKDLTNVPSFHDSSPSDFHNSIKQDWDKDISLENQKYLKSKSEELK